MRCWFKWKVIIIHRFLSELVDMYVAVVKQVCITVSSLQVSASFISFPSPLLKQWQLQPVLLLSVVFPLVFHIYPEEKHAVILVLVFLRRRPHVYKPVSLSIAHLPR